MVRSTGFKPWRTRQTAALDVYKGERTGDAVSTGLVIVWIRSGTQNPMWRVLSMPEGGDHSPIRSGVLVGLEGSL